MDAVVEFRQYTCHPGQRDALIALFDREFVESQEALGARILGQFRDLDRPERFVWVRAFPDMDTRLRQLTAFYSGSVWKAHREAANATIVDSDNVLLLRPARAGSGFAGAGARPPVGATEPPAARWLVAIARVEPAAEAAWLARFEREVAPAWGRDGAVIAARFVTEPGPNNYPRLPVREGEHVAVWFARFADDKALERFLGPGGIEGKRAALPAGLGRAELVRLAPTARSGLR
jgi:hypothetical protein